MGGKRSGPRTIQPLPAPVNPKAGSVCCAAHLHVSVLTGMTGRGSIAHSAISATNRPTDRFTSGGDMRTASAILTLLIVSLSVVPANADECEDAGIAAMLVHVEQTCPSYRLTRAGRKALQNLTLTTSKFGENICRTKGQLALLQDLKAFFPQLSRPEELMNSAMCDAVANLLEAFCLISDHQPLDSWRSAGSGVSKSVSWGRTKVRVTKQLSSQKLGGGR